MNPSRDFNGIKPVNQINWRLGFGEAGKNARQDGRKNQIFLHDLPTIAQKPPDYPQ
jgi:hypothetical protein